MWDVITTECFDEWFLAQSDALRESVYEAMGVLEKFGPTLGRPYVDTLNDSDFANMKELRIQHHGNIRVADVKCPSAKTYARLSVQKSSFFTETQILFEKRKG